MQYTIRFRLLAAASVVCSLAFCMPQRGLSQSTNFTLSLVAQTSGVASPFYQLGDLVLFARITPKYGRELWSFRGDPKSMRLVADIQPGSGSGLRNGVTGWSLTIAGSDAYFIANDGVHGDELWRTDGTAPGTFMVADIAPGSAASMYATSTRYQSILAVGDRVFFGANDGVHGAEPWTSDGTASGTRMLGDIVRGPLGSEPLDFLAFGKRAYFTLNDGRSSRGREIWWSDGRPLYTKPLADLYPGGESSDPLFVVFRDTIHGVARIDGAQFALFRSDGTSAGTKVYHRFVPFRGPYIHLDVTSIHRDRLVASRDALCLTGSQSGRSGFILSDGSSAGTRFTTTFSKRLDILVNDAQVWFRAEALQSKATRILVAENGVVRTLRSEPHQFAYLGRAIAPGRTLIGLFETATGLEHYESDGTIAGTQLNIDFYTGPPSGWGGHYYDIEGELYLFTSALFSSTQFLYRIERPGALVARLGGPCGSTPVRLYASRADLGKPLELESVAPSAGGFAFHWLGARKSIVFAGCARSLDPASAIFVGVSSGTKIWSVAVPNDSSLRGVKVVAEAWWVKSGPLPEVSFSDRYALRVGG